MYNKYQQKFTSKDIQRMRDLVEEGYAIHYVARELKCRANTVWHHCFDLIPPKKLTKKQQQRNLKGSNLTIAKVKKIRQLGLDGMDAVEIGRRYGISASAALAVIKGKTFRWVPGMTLSGEIVPIEYEFTPKTDLIRGPKKGSKKSVKSGVLKKYAEKYNVKPTTICKWISRGKLQLKKSELVSNE